jgi:aspartyl-tRNA(Asn)/glutamyl-tRNA(Gln) amidotransferase subunit A
VFNRLHVMEMKPDFAEATAGRDQDELYMMSKTMLATPDTTMKDYIEAEQAAERLRDGFADYFQRYDALITPVQPIPPRNMAPPSSSSMDGPWMRPTCRAPPCL